MSTASTLPAQPADAAQPLYLLKNVSKEYAGPSENIMVLRDVSLVMQEGETIAIMGASGSGKSSLLHLLGTLATPSEGTVIFRGRSLTELSAVEKARIRNREMGFVFQFHHLLPEFTTLENVAMQAVIGGMSRAEARQEALGVLAQVGLEERGDFNVSYLSGGERQRAAIARAVVQRPKVLLADEPTGNLDEKTGRLVTDLLLELNRKFHMAMVVVTHNPELASRMDRCFELKSGELYEQTR